MTPRNPGTLLSAGLLLVFLIAPIHSATSTAALGYQDTSGPEVIPPGTEPALPAAESPTEADPADRVPAAKRSDAGGSTLLPIPIDTLPETQSIESYIDGATIEEGNCELDSSCYNSGCESSGGFWARGDYLIWWSKGNRLPPLATTSVAGTPIGVAGELDKPGTSVLFGGSRVSRMARSGYRITLGYWADCRKTCGIEGDYLDTGANRVNFFTGSTGSPILARPFYDVVEKEQRAELTAYPDRAAGQISSSVSSHLQSAGLRLRHNLACYTWCEDACCEDACCEDDSCGEESCGTCGIGNWGAARSFRLDLIGGYRYYRLNDRFTINEDLVVTNTIPGPTPPIIGTIINLFDSFHTTNDFNGGELGLVANFQKGCWSLELLGKLGIGNNRQTVFINGSRAVTTPPTSDPDSFSEEGGLLTQQSNIGTHSRDTFVLVPQFGVEVGYQLSCNLRAYAGYNFIYWSRVLRAGDQIDLRIDPANFVGEPPEARESAQPFPAVLLAESSFWAQGINLGLELRY